jgi:hypothetical protein
MREMSGVQNVLFSYNCDTGTPAPQSGKRKNLVSQMGPYLLLFRLSNGFKAILSPDSKYRVAESCY